MLQNIKLSTFQSNEIWCAAQIRKNSSQIFYLMGPIEWALDQNYPNFF